MTRTGTGFNVPDWDVRSSTVTIPPGSGNISSVEVTLTGISHACLGDWDVVLVSPGGTHLAIMANVPDYLLADCSNWTGNLTIRDNADTLMSNTAYPTTGGAYKPTVIDVGANVVIEGVCSPCAMAATRGSATFASQFPSSLAAEGVWTLYVKDHMGEMTGSLGSWTLTIYPTAVNTTTTVASSSGGNQSATGSSVTFTATVTATGPVTTGTVAFKDGASVLTGCGAVNLDGEGHASCATSALTEGRHTITAEYSGAIGYNTGSGSLTQLVDDTTTVTGLRFCNPGTLTLPASGTPAAYPLRINVSGVTQPISTMMVRLDDLSYQPNVLQMMLVGPDETVANSLDFFSHTANATAVTEVDLVFSDTASARIPSGVQLTPGSYQPTSTSAANAWPAPAPAGPYQFAAPAGDPSAHTFSSVFNGDAANGWWSLYISSTGAGAPGTMGPFCIEFGAPDLTIDKFHSGSFHHGQTDAVYALRVTNSGTGPTSGLVTVTDTLPPSGLTATDITGSGWDCTLGTLTCTRSDVLAPGDSYPDIGVTVTVAWNAASSVTNSATVAGGGDSGGGSDSDPTEIVAISDLTVAKTHTGDFTQGQTGATYSIVVTNNGTGATSGQVTLEETIQPGLTATNITGEGWSCVLGTLTCTRSDVLGAGLSYPAITLTVNVAASAPELITNSVTVSGGGQWNTSNDVANNPTTILGSPDLTVEKMHGANFRQGQTGATYTITVTNAGRGATTAEMTLVDTLPAGLTATGMSGTNWSCTLGATPTCTRTAPLAGGVSSVITLTVDVAANANSGSNSVSVSGGGDVNPGNNSDTDPTTVDPVADLTVTKTHTGDFTQGQTGAQYTITVTNEGPGPTTALVTVVDSLPTGLTATGIGGEGWGCVLGTLTCTRSDVLASGGTYPVIILTVTVANNAGASVTNRATVSGGGEAVTNNNTVDNPTTIVQFADLTLTKTHVGDFHQGQTGAHYTLTVTNIGDGATSGAVTVTENVVGGLTVTGMAGTNWNCNVGARTCTRDDALAPDASYEPITVTVNVAADAASSVTNTASVAGGGEIITGNDTASDPTTIRQVADLRIAKTHSGNFRQGQTGAQYTITVSNSGPGPTDAAVSVSDILPPGLTATAMSGTGWSCTLTPLECTRNTVLAAGGSYPVITLTVDVAAGAPSSVTNSVTVSGGGEIDTTNNSASDVSTVDQVADLVVAKTHTGNFTQGQAGAQYTITVSNTGPGPTVGTVTVIDSLPAGLAATALSGTGWSCVLGTLTCTTSNVLGTGASYPDITLTVTVANNAPAGVTNSVSVSGGGELNTGNNTAGNLTTIIQLPDLAIAKTHTGHFTRGQQGTYTITVGNVGSVPTSGTMVVTDTLPAGLTAAAIADATGWSCVLGPPVVCDRSDALNPASNHPAITLVVNVDPEAATPLVNTVTVTASPDVSLANNTATDTTTVLVVPEITWATPAPITYGTALSGTQLNASSTAPGTFAYSPDTDTVLPAGPHTLNVTFTPSDPNAYTAAAASATLTVNKATPVITWPAPAAITYGTALSGAQLNATTGVAGTFVYSPAPGTVLTAGSYTLDVTFTPTDTDNYNGATASVPLTVNKATPIITWATPAAIPYGTALSGTQLNATTPVAGTFVYSPMAGTVLAVGNHTLDTTFTPTDTANYNGATASVPLTVNKATPVITWATPAAITYGTALSDTQLNATSTVAGAFVYAPAAGTVLTAGSQTLNVTFTPTDAANYNNATGSVTLVVNQQAPVITWATPGAITYGTAVGATQLNATANVTGAFAYTPAAGTVPPAGDNTLSVTFTPDDAVNYSNTAASVTLHVNQATPVVTWTAPADITYGTPLGAAQLSATANVTGTFAYSPLVGTVLGAGPHTLNVTFTPDSSNYSSATANVTLTVNKATPVVTWTAPAAMFYGTPLGEGQLSAAANAPGSFAYTPPAGTVLFAGAHTLNVAFTPADTANYHNAGGTAPLTVNKATPAIAWTAPAPITYGTALSATQLSGATNVPGTFQYTPASGTVLPAGSHTLAAAFTPADTANYNNAAATVPLTVGLATPVITWATPAPIVFGAALSATQLSATADVPGTFQYTPAAGTVLRGGNHTLSATFTPADPGSYTGATATVTLLVQLAPQSVSFSPIADRWHGDASVALDATSSSGRPVTFAVVSGPATVSGNTLLITGVGLVTVRAWQDGDNDWQPAEQVQSFRSAYRTRIQAGPGAIAVSVDGRAFISAADFLWDPETTHRIAVPPFQATMPGAGYRFGSWSDGGGAEHSITVASEDATYLATFVPQFLLAVEVRPGASAGRVAVTPESAGGFYDAASKVTLEANPESGHYFSEYTGGVASPNRTANVEMTSAKTVVAHFAAGMKLDAAVDAAGYRRGPLAPGGLYSLFGWGMGSTDMASLPLPATLGGCTLTIRDRNGTERQAALLYVSERQVNFMVPEGLAPGPGTLRLTNSAGSSCELAVELGAVAPGLFTANQSGQGAPAGTMLRVAGDGSRTETPLAECGSEGCVPAVIDLGGLEDQVFLVLYGTGLRHGTNVTASIGGVAAPVLFAGAQGFYEGLDQVNLRVPRELAGRGECDVIVTVDGVAANTVKVRVEGGL